MEELMYILSRVIFVTIVITIVLAIMSYGIYKIREKQKPRLPKREWTLPEEEERFIPVLFERIEWNDILKNNNSNSGEVKNENS